MSEEDVRERSVEETRCVLRVDFEYFVEVVERFVEASTPNVDRGRVEVSWPVVVVHTDGLLLKTETPLVLQLVQLVCV